MVLVFFLGLKRFFRAARFLGVKHGGKANGAINKFRRLVRFHAVERRFNSWLSVARLHEMAGTPKRRMVGMILQQPWASLVVEGVFPVLVRGKAILIRGPVAVVARGIDESALVDGFPPAPKRFPQPAVLGVVSIVECMKVPRSTLMEALVGLYGKTFAKFYPAHYIPDTSPVYLWVLKSPKRIRGGAVPIPTTRHRGWMPISPRLSSRVYRR